MTKKLALIAAAVMLLATGAQAQDSPKREFRSAWVAGMNIDWPMNTSSKGTTATAQANAKKELTTYLDNFKKQNFTGICLHVRPRADAYYKSTLEPWSADISGTRGVDPGWDPLAFAVEECHKRGLEIYAWVNPFRVNANGVDYTTSFDKQWESNKWLLKSGNWTCFNPAVEGARKHCLDVIKEIYTNYDVDGLLFDDYFYPGDGMPSQTNGSVSSADGDYEHYMASGTTLSIDDWRRENVNTFVKELYDMIQQDRPDMRFGIGPAGVGGASASKYGLSKPAISSTDWMYAKIYCDPLAWLSDGSIDFVSPQIYWGRTHSTAPFGPLTKWWSEVADHFGRHMYVSAATYKALGSYSDFGTTITAGANEISAQVDLTRDYTLNDAPGMIYYNTKSMSGSNIAISNKLGEANYQLPALIPAITWKKGVNYAAPTGLKQSGTTLSWTATQGQGKAIIRYTVYAIPESKTIDEALAGNGDGISNEYLLGVSYANSYTLTSAQATGHWYAVCVYDGYGNESDYATLGYVSTPSDAVTLTSPANGATAAWTQDFTWTTVSQGTYTFELATDSEFKNIVSQQADLTAGKATVNFDGVTDNTLCYWRVTSKQPEKVKTVSQTRTVRSPKRAAAAQPVLTSPVDGAEIEGANIEFAWTCSDAAVSQYELQIVAKGASFTTPKYSKTVTAKSATVAASSVGTGTFDWRVVAQGDRVTATASKTASFSIAKLDVGTYEPGYVIATDGDTYPKTKDGIVIECLWMRRAGTGASNISFSNNGSLNRGMAATSTAVYLSGRSANSSTADIYLSEYSATTGEHIRDIQLSENGKVAYYPCNDVIKDTAGNILIANLSTDSSNDPIVLHLVDLKTGELTQVASVKSATSRWGTTKRRIDHVSVYGDVTTGNFTVFAAVASSAYLTTWTVSNGTAGTAKSTTIRTFYPSSASNFGIAPRTYPVSATEVYVDGGATAWTLYNTSGTVKGSFSTNTALAPENVTDNGGRVFSIGNDKLHVYSHAGAEAGGLFRIAKQAANAGDNAQFTGMTQLWDIPTGGMGTVVSTTQSAPVDVVQLAPASANVYVYSAGNGLAAYHVTDTSTGNIDVIATDDNAPAEYYDLQGRRVDNPTPGIYIKRQGAKTTKVVF